MGKTYTKTQAAATKKYQSKKQQLKIWLNPDEKKQIEEKAKNENCSITEYIKKRIL